MDVVGEAVEERAGEALGAEHLGPLVEGQVGGDQGRGSMTPRTKTKWLLAGGFLVMIALIVVLGIGAIRVTNTLAGLTTQMYRHPLIVSNAVLAEST